MVSGVTDTARQDVAMSRFAAAVDRIKGNLIQAVPASLIQRCADALGLTGRDRVLTPVVTTHLALSRALHGGTAISHLCHLTPHEFTPSAYCQAIARLPEAFFATLQTSVTGQIRRDQSEDCWHGHRVFLIDGTGISMPDTPALQAAFGQPPGQAKGCGFPVAHLLALFDAHSGYLLRTQLAPLRTHDLAHAVTMHGAMRTGDLLVGDRAFGSFAHLASLQQRGLHGLFRLPQRRPHGTAWDRHVVYEKPARKPSWMTAAAYAKLPATSTVREVRVKVKLPGCRVQYLVLVTTLLDQSRYPAKELAKLYQLRWRIENDLRDLKITLGMDILKSKTVAGVNKEVQLFSIVYNLVRRVMVDAADRQGVAVDRISFVDALRGLTHAKPGDTVPELIVNPERPGRFEPRVKKRRPKQYPLMKKPRNVLKQEMLEQRLAA